MKFKKFGLMFCSLSLMVLLVACGSKDTDTKDTEATESAEEISDGASGGSVDLDAGDEIASDKEVSSSENAESDDTETTEETDVATEATSEEPEEVPESIKFVIVQNARSDMFTLTNAEGQTFTIDADSKSGYEGTLNVIDGEYVTGGSGTFTIPYSENLTLTDMDDDIVYVSAEYPYVVSVAVQGADIVVIGSDRTVTITSSGSDVFSYHVWLPSKGTKKESQSDSLTGKGSGTLKFSWDKTTIKVTQVQGTSVSLSTDGDEEDDEDSDVADVDWQIACPWADKIAKGTWSDGADLSNVEELKKGIMSAKFIPVTKITEESKTSKITFYDSDNNKLGTMVFWQKGKHIQFDGKSFDYDDLGLE